MKYLYKDTILIFYPKSGRTWLRMILANILKLDGKWDPKTEMFFCRHWIVEEFYAPRDYKKIIYLSRDPADVVVSLYFERSKRIKHKYQGTISEFIRDGEYGIENIIRFNKEWADFLWSWSQYKHPRVTVTYERMHKDIAAEVSYVLGFIGYKTSDSVISRAIEESKFENMRKIEKQGGGLIAQYRGRFGRNFDEKDSESFRCRKGKVGNYNDYLSEEDINYINEVKNGIL